MQGIIDNTHTYLVTTSQLRLHFIRRGVRGKTIRRVESSRSCSRDDSGIIRQRPLAGSRYMVSEHIKHCESISKANRTMYKTHAYLATTSQLRLHRIRRGVCRKTICLVKPNPQVNRVETQAWTRDKSKDLVKDEPNNQRP